MILLCSFYDLLVQLEKELAKKSSGKIANFHYTLIHTRNRVVFDHARKVFSCEITRDAFFTGKIV